MSSTTAVVSAEKLTVSEVVITAVADAEGTRSTELTPPLYDVIDPEALDAIQESDAVAKIEFDYCGHSVLIDHEGRVIIDDEHVHHA